MNGYSIWLDLEKESRSSYRKIISTLSRRLDSPFFEPHCTIYGHMNTNLEDLKAIITKLVLKNNQFSTLGPSPLLDRDWTTRRMFSHLGPRALGINHANPHSVNR